MLAIVPAHDTTDAQLVRSIAAGDRGCLGTLYDRHAPIMIGVGLRMLPTQVEVEDILHDVFLEVWRRAHTYDPNRASVRTWLLVRMRSRCLDRLKSAGYSRRRSLDTDERSAAAEGPAAADRSRVRDAIHKLNLDQRNVLMLGYFGGLSSTEIAAELDIPVGTVKSRMAAAVRSLRRQLKETHQ